MMKRVHDEFGLLACQCPASSRWLKSSVVAFRSPQRQRRTPVQDQPGEQPLDKDDRRELRHGIGGNKWKQCRLGLGLCALLAMRLANRS